MSAELFQRPGWRVGMKPHAVLGICRNTTEPVNHEGELEMERRSAIPVSRSNFYDCNLAMASESCCHKKIHFAGRSPVLAFHSHCSRKILIVLLSLPSVRWTCLNRLLGDGFSSLNSKMAVHASARSVGGTAVRMTGKMVGFKPLGSACV